MDTQPLSLHHLIRPPVITETDHSQGKPASSHPAVLALHGRGSNEGDLIALADYLSPRLFWVSPRAPFTLGEDSFEWFQMIQIGKPDPARLAGALNTIDTFIDEILAAYPIDSSKLYLLGFSQGTVVSLSYTLTKPQRAAGVIAQSGYLPHDANLDIDEKGIKGKPILFTHGTHDQMLPIEWARQSRDTLHSLGAQVNYHEFSMGHSINTESLAVVKTWLDEQLA